MIKELCFGSQKLFSWEVWEDADGCVGFERFDPILICLDVSFLGVSVWDSVTNEAEMMGGSGCPFVLEFLL